MGGGRFVVVGGGVAGLAAVVKIAEAGGDVDLFSVVPCRRSPSVSTQDGVNAAMNGRGGDDSPAEHFHDTIHAGDFLANQPPVKAMCEAAPALVHLLDRWGVSWSRTPEGLVDFRRSGASKRLRTAWAGATTGQQVLYALDEQVRRFEAAARVRRFEHQELVQLVLDDHGAACGIVAMDLRRMTAQAFPARAVILATGGAGALFGKSTSSQVSNGAAASLVHQLGAVYANGEFVQVHPTTIPGPDKLRPLSESLLAEGGRLWVPSDGGHDERAGKQRPAAGQPWYFLAERYPAQGNLVPADVASREIWNVGRELALGVDGGDQVYLDVTHLGRAVEPLLSMYRKFVGEDPARVPMKVAAGVHGTLGGLLVDDAHMTTIPGLFAAGEVASQLHGANRLGANSLLSCLHGGFLAGPAAMRWASGRAAAAEPPRARYDQAVAATNALYFEQLAKMDGAENPYRLGAELGEWMTDHCTVVRHNDKLRATEEKIVELMARWNKCRALDDARVANQSLMYLRQLWHTLVLARVMVRGALLRDESRGAHFKPEFPRRDDARFLKTTLARHSSDGGGDGDGPVISYGDVDVSLLPPGERTL